jgi:hypothetical protein
MLHCNTGAVACTVLSQALPRLKARTTLTAVLAERRRATAIVNALS